MTFDEKKKILIEYMKLKMEEADWHGVSDCANDLRELEASPAATKPPIVWVEAGSPLEKALLSHQMTSGTVVQK